MKSSARKSDGDSVNSIKKFKGNEDDREEENDERSEVLDKNNSHYIKYDKHHNPN
jgi:hypothetical protein